MSETETSELATVRGDVGLGVDAGVLSGGDRVLLGRQTVGIETHRVKHVVSGHPFEPGEHIGGDEAERMANMQSGP